jgi:hypothetical protein
MAPARPRVCFDRSWVLSAFSVFFWFIFERKLWRYYARIYVVVRVVYSGTCQVLFVYISII